MIDFENEQMKKKKLRKKPLYICLCILCLIIGNIGGYIYYGISHKSHANNKITIYDEVAGLLSQYFVDTTDSQENLQERMLYGMVAGLGDRHTSYLSTQQSKDLALTINGSLQGIGVTFFPINAGAFVTEVHQNTPAQKAGIKKGDIITHVQGTSIERYTADKISNVIKGENGTQVELRLLRNGKSLDLKCLRGHIETSVQYEVRKENKNKIGYLKITTFGEETNQFVENALKEFEKENVRQLVLDLRDNGGGYLEAAKNILDLFVESDEVLIRVQNKKKEQNIYKSTKRKKYNFDQGFILVNGQSASASEVMTGVLKELLGYRIVGTKTYGKGTVQTQHILSDSSVLKFTNAKWLTPSGKSINGIGFQPDVVVETKSINNFYIGDLEEKYHYDQVNVQVSYMQKMLKELGYSIDRTDGYFSIQTKKALEKFEKEHGLKADGIYEQKDMTILLNVLSYHIYNVEKDNAYEKVVKMIG